MPLELIIPERRSLELREYEEEPLGPEEVRVRSSFSSNKHGTLFRKYRDDADNWHTAFEREHRISREEAALPAYPLSVGNMTVGIVTQTGTDVEAFAEGDRVYGHLPIRETHAVPEADLRHAPEGMSPEAIVFTNPAGVGVHLVRGGGVQLGDTVAVFGAGAIGLMAAQLARVGGRGASSSPSRSSAGARPPGSTARTSSWIRPRRTSPGGSRPKSRPATRPASTGRSKPAPPTRASTTRSARSRSRGRSLPVATTRAAPRRSDSEPSSTATPSRFGRCSRDRAAS